MTADVLMLAIADGLHHAEDLVGETLCWCRRIATTDGTVDGPIDPGWSSDGEYDPKEWGTTAERPTQCEKASMSIIETFPKGMTVVFEDPTG